MTEATCTSRPVRRGSTALLFAASLATSLESGLVAASQGEGTSAWPLGMDVLLEGGHHGRALLSSGRVGNLGSAIFVILLFMGICLAVCLLGSRSKTPWIYFLTSTVVFAIVFGILAGSPKGPAPVKPDSGYDQTIIPMTIIMIFMCLGILVAGLGLLAFQAMPQHYAKPLSYHADVLRA